MNYTKRTKKKKKKLHVAITIEEGKNIVMVTLFAAKPPKKV
jgi:hypothetical protein